MPRGDEIQQGCHASSRNRVTIYKIILICCLSMFAACNDAQNNKEDRCEFTKRFIKKEFRGVVLDKFNDVSSHYAPTLLIFDSTASDTITFVYGFDLGGVFHDATKKGDHLDKRSGEMAIKVNDRLYDVDFGCNELTRDLMYKER